MKDFWKRKRNKRIAASALAVVMAGFLVWGLFPWQAAAAEADPVTAGKLNSRTDTQDVGRVWTDKSVSSGDITLDAKATGKDAITIKKEGSSDFLIGLSGYVIRCADHRSGLKTAGYRSGAGRVGKHG